MSVPPSLTLTRPLGPTERFYYEGRGSRGTADPFIIVSFEWTSKPFTTDDVAHAWALLRLHHPLLASSISSADSTPAFVFVPPLTAADALERARLSIDFSAFDVGECESTLSALRARLADVDHDVVDMHASAGALTWLAEIGSAQPAQYILVVRSTHFVCDAQSMFTVARELFALLVDPEGTREKLQRFFVGTPLAKTCKLPSPLEDIYPDYTTTSVDDQQKGMEVFSAQLGALAGPHLGLVATGTADEKRIAGRSIHHVFSSADTSELVKRCKAHGITVTQFICAAEALAALPFSADPSSSTDDLCFSISLAADLRARLPPIDAGEIAVRVTLFSTSMRLPPGTTPYSAAAAWDAARQCGAGRDAYFGSPYVWHLVQHSTETWLNMFAALRSGAPEVLTMLSAPSLPGLSSLGNCDAYLPARYAAPNGLGELRVRDMAIAARATAAIPVVHAWTYAGRLNLCLTHNAAHADRGLMDAYFRSLVDVITQVGVCEEES
ncbi:hypothetical protein B0H21DRAFT_895193 [Amylocystis lapponica]|nr:hypothetical protein B0H21DRAFT_895193 [Amylocystis lapponica]